MTTYALLPKAGANRVYGEASFGLTLQQLHFTALDGRDLRDGQEPHIGDISGTAIWASVRRHDAPHLRAYSLPGFPTGD